MKNLLLYSVSGHIEGYFFCDSNNIKHNQTTVLEYEYFSVPIRSGIIDSVAKFPDAKDIDNIFIVSGPASFTSLRNISVFVSVFQKFSTKKVNIFSLPTYNFFEIIYPNFSKYILSVGRRESFVFENNSYTKYKNIEILKNIPQDDLENLYAGFFSDGLLKNFSTDFAVPEHIAPEIFLHDIIKEKNKFSVPALQIDYGALPNIG